MKKIKKAVLGLLGAATICGSTCFALIRDVRHDIKVRWIEKNSCWLTESRTIKPTGIMIHSTATPGTMAQRFQKAWNTFNPNGREVAVHAFVDAEDIVQCLPWCLRGWHCGRGANGSGNNTHISIEMCEPSGIIYNKEHNKIIAYPRNAETREYFNRALKNMVDLCAYLVEQFDIDIDAPNSIICHQEGYQKGIASNHADVLHWWPIHGVSMDIFKDLVKRTLAEDETIAYNFDILPIPAA